MKPLTRKEDPTGFLSLFRYEASMRFGNPVGHIEGHGRYGNYTANGPGRRSIEGKPKHANGSKWLRPNVMRRGH